MDQKKIEQRALYIGIFFNILMGIAGLIAYRTTKVEALFIDAYFTVMTVLSGAFAIFISKVSANRTTRFPNGFFILEPIYALAKSMLTIALLVFSTISVSNKAYAYFVLGHGKILNLLPIIPYALVMVILCFSLSIFYSRQNKATNSTSTLLLAETKNTLIDGIMSAGVGIAALLVLFINQNSSLGFLLYTADFFVTVLLVISSIKTPFNILKNSLFEILGSTLADKTIYEEIENCVHSHIKQKSLIKHCFIYKLGMSFKICIKLSNQMQAIDTDYLHKKQQSILNELGKKYEFVTLEFIY
ncbi:hypothetical protein ATZ33_14280 [Enterococcus silesiacus]|uniref:Cation efflux family protein n=1 Tax=Enterococcus silesiacus TaxID=332949 RepID=A0A0S3KDZ4_9ENTE|nr:cation transporter [Enterococcus silesiacus]ALS02503.1 hypothetical protein ATZ33_14280 [Enterococcus silesiacus]OJG93586.1 cation efflux family protein [Enterococcus silesiacus]